MAKHFKESTSASDEFEVVTPETITANAYAEGDAIPSRRRRWPIVLLLFLVLLSVGGFFGWQWWQKRPVEISVNGETREIAIGSTLQDVFDEVKPSVTPGNLVSVSGNVLEAGRGVAFTATFNGEDVASDALATKTISGGETISFGDGADITEDFTTEVFETQPKIEFQVKEGTGEKGYMVQQGTVQYVYQWGQIGKQEVRTGTVSGETADGETIQELKNCIVMVQDIHPDNDEKLVALTFDDGPSIYTESYMEILKRYEIPATFMMIGEQVADSASIVKANLEAGNELASHTWSHPQLTTLDAEALRSELSSTTDAIRDAAGVTVTQIRPPYGDLDNDVWMKSNGLLSLSIYWTHDSEDWKQPGADTIVSYCTDWMEPGSVILMHDGGGPREQDLEALPTIIEAWQNAGYKFVTLEELLRSDSSIPKEIVSGQVSMPENAVWPKEAA